MKPEPRKVGEFALSADGDIRVGNKLQYDVWIVPRGMVPFFDVPITRPDGSEVPASTEPPEDEPDVKRCPAPGHEGEPLSAVYRELGKSAVFVHEQGGLAHADAQLQWCDVRNLEYPERLLPSGWIEAVRMSIDPGSVHLEQMAQNLETPSPYGPPHKIEVGPDGQPRHVDVPQPDYRGWSPKQLRAEALGRSLIKENIEYPREMLIAALERDDWPIRIMTAPDPEERTE